MIFATIQQWESIVLAERKKQIFILSFLFFQIFSSAWDQGMITIIKTVATRELLRHKQLADLVEKYDIWAQQSKTFNATNMLLFGPF